MIFYHGLCGPAKNIADHLRAGRYAIAPPGRLTKLLIMRINLVILLIVITSLHVWAVGKAQTVTLTLKDATLEQALRHIKAQTGYGYFFEGGNLTQSTKVTLSLSNATLTQALDKSFAGQPYTYTIAENIIVVKSLAGAQATKPQQPQKRIKGKVTGPQGQPLAGASVYIKGRQASTTTDEQGNYTITANEGETLVVTYIGFETQEQTIGAGNEINISLKEAVGLMDAVNIVSTGFQQLPKERATGSFATVSQQQLERQVTPDIISRLEGITSGLVFNTDNRGNRQIRVRGQSTIFANAEPLIVVDNFPYEGSIDNINPNDIESITLSKDAAAASIWGVRAGNGVIVITTKKGKLNQPLNISLTANLTTTGKPDIYYSPMFLNSSDFIDVEKQLFSTGFYNQYENAVNKPALSPVVELLIKKRDNPSQAANIDAQIDALRGIDVRDALSRYLYQNTISQQYALNFNGGTDKVTYILSVGADLGTGSTVGQSNQRYTINAQSTYTPIKNLEISTGIGYVQNVAKVDNLLSQMPVSMAPYTKIIDDNGNHLPIVNEYRATYVDAAPSKGFLNWQFTPLDEIGRNTSNNTTTENRLTAALKYTFIKGLNAELRYQYQKQQIGRETVAAADSYFTRNLVNRYSSVNTSGVVTINNIPPGAIYTFSNSIVKANNFRGQLNYNNTFGNHAITALVGYEVREIVRPQTYGRFYGYDPDVATIYTVNYTSTFLLQPSGTASIPSLDGVSNATDRYISYFANAAYTFKDRYTLSGSGRIDGSNFFGVYTNQREVPLWSVGGKWDAGKEHFYKLSWLPKLSIRATFGYNGNLDKSLSAFTTAKYYSAAFYTGARYANIINPPNPELRWEKTSQLNLGLDFGLKNNVLSGTVDVYFKRGKDMIGDAIMAPSSGITRLRGNFAQTKGNGIDLVLNSNNLNGSVKWQTSYLFNYATDKVTAYEVNNTVPTMVMYGGGYSANVYAKEGYPVYSLFSYKWAGLSPVNGDPQGYINGVVSTN